MMEDLLQQYDARVKDLKKWMVLRSLGVSEELSNALRSLHSELSVLEKQLVNTQNYLKEERSQLYQMEILENKANEQAARVNYIKENLPPHLPGLSPPNSEESTISTRKETVLRPPQQAPPPKSPPSKSIKLRKIRYITIDDFESVPKYMKGRLQRDHINTAIDEIYDVISAKFKVNYGFGSLISVLLIASVNYNKILNTPRSQLGKTSMKHWRGFQAQATPETKGTIFFVDEDIKTFKSDATALKPGMSTKTILTVLRHLSRIKEVRGGGLIRYIII